MKKLMLTLLMSMIASPNLLQASCSASASLDALLNAATTAYNTASANNDTAYANYSAAASAYNTYYTKYVGAYNAYAANLKTSIYYKGWGDTGYAKLYLSRARSHYSIYSSNYNAAVEQSNLMSTYSSQMTSYQSEMSKLSTQKSTYEASITAICAPSGSTNTAGGSVDSGNESNWFDDETSLVGFEDMNRLQYSGASTAIVAQNSDFDFLDDVEKAQLSMSGSELVGIKLYDSDGNRISLPSGTSLSHTTKGFSNTNLIIIKVTRNSKKISLIIDKVSLDVFSTDDTAIANIESVLQIGRSLNVDGETKSVVSVNARNASGSLVSIGLWVEDGILRGADL